MLDLLAAVALFQAQQTIVVVGRPLENRCESQRCSPSEDSDESIRVAQALFLAGDYWGARRTIRKAISRLRGSKASDPLAVAAVYRADSTIAAHWGENKRSSRSGYRAATILREALGPTDPRSIVAASLVGMMEVQLGRNERADRTFRDAAAHARDAGLALLADALEVRRAWALSATKPGDSLASLVAFAENAAIDPRIRVQAAVLAFRIARELGDEPVEQRMLKVVASDNRSDAPVLLHSPVAPSLDHGDRRSRQAVPRLSLSDVGRSLQWLDIGFWVRPEGSVEEVSILDGSKRASWGDRVMKSIAARRYAPVAAEPGDPGWYRVERFTTRSAFAEKPGRIDGRGGRPELHSVDITNGIARPGNGAETQSRPAADTPAR